MKKSSLKLRVPALLLGLALVLGLALGCSTDAADDTKSSIDGLKLSKPQKVEVTTSTTSVAVTALAVSPPVPQFMVVKFKAPDQGPRQVKYTIWVKSDKSSKEYLVGSSGATPAYGRIDGDTCVSAVQNQVILSGEGSPAGTYEVPDVSSLSDQTLYRENRDDDYWYARLDVDALLSQLDITTTGAAGIFDIGALASGESVSFLLGVQAVVPYDPVQDDPRYFVNPSDVVWVTKTRITVSNP